MGPNGLPEQWWEDSKGIYVKDFAHFKKLVMKKDSEYNNKHVFLDIFMERCHFCYEFQGQWNHLVDKMRETYGEQIVFL